MEPVALTIAALGALLFAGLLADALAGRTPLPRVTLLLLVGVAAGPLALDLLPEGRDAWFEVSADIALVMVGFLLGGEFTSRHVQELRATVFGVALVESATTAAFVGTGLLLVGTEPAIALSLAGIAAATDPAATLAVLQETGARGRLPRVARGVVAADDVMGIVLFSVLVTLAGLVSGAGFEVGPLLEAGRDLGGSLLLGLILGAVAAPITGRLRPGEAILEEALGLVLTCAGLAVWLDLSPILAAMVMGATLANLATHHERPFHEIEHVEWPFLVVFFILAGASLELDALASIGPIALGYVVLRSAGKLTGASLGGRVAGLDRRASGRLGLSLMPQAGVALGLALAAALRFPDQGTRILNVAVVGTVIFELGGPLLARRALEAEPSES